MSGRDGERLRLRAAWVAAAAVGFWVIALGLVAVLAGGGVAIVVFAPEYGLAAPIAGLLACTLAVGLVPRGAKRADEEPPPLGPSEEEKLHALVRDVAARVGARPPEALYVFHRANAFAGAERRRVFARRRMTVGVGLPLLARLNEREVRAVVAHEMGHHARGDVALGPWIHRTRRAIARTVDRLEGSSFWLHLPFALYADLFMKLSVRISRAQEIAADAIAARVAGASAAASALRKVDVIAAAWDGYFGSEVVPILERGRLPRLLDGFDLYWRATQTPGTPAHESFTHAVRSAQPRADDTHPSLGERIAMLDDPPPLSDDAPHALGLLADVAAMEERVVRAIMRNANAPLARVEWDHVVEEIWLPAWREAIAPHQRALSELAPSALPSAIAQWEPLARATRRGPAILSPEAERRRLAELLGVWLLVRVVDRGFSVRAPPGLAVVAEREGRSLEPFAIVRGMVRGEGLADWPARCADLGI